MAQRPYVCTIDNIPVDLLGADIDHGYDITSASADLRLAAPPSWLNWRQRVEIRVLWDGQYVPRFVGEIVEDGDEYWPYTETVKAVGKMARTQLNYHSELLYTAQAADFIANDLLEKAGVSERDVQGSETVFGVAQDVVLKANTPTATLLDELGQVTDCKAFDRGDGVVAYYQIDGRPAQNAAFTFVEGVHPFRASRPRSILGVKNKVTVLGLPQIWGTPKAERQAANSNVPNPPEYDSFEFSSDLIETNEYADEVCARKMQQNNRVIDRAEIDALCVPWLRPGMTVALVSAKLRLPGGANYLIRHTRDRLSEAEITTSYSLEGGVGDAGYSTLVPPIPSFTYFVEREGYEVAGVVTYMYTVTADGSASYDPDGDPATLVFAWENSANADVSSERKYSTAFTQAQFEAGATITLLVTDIDANTRATTQTIVAPLGGIQMRRLWVAALGGAEASADAGGVWNTQYGSFVATPEQAGEDWTLFGASDGKLYYNADYLLDAPELIKAF
ncbi:MAG: hypothetical protein ACYC4L_04615 [Chloroflexota bacterium]